MREAVLARYAEDPERPACACCGDTRRLCIDHLAGGTGNIERRATMGRGHRSGIPYHRWLVKSGLPDGYQVLCEACNSHKRDGDRCPHSGTLEHIWNKAAARVECLFV